MTRMMSMFMIATTTLGLGTTARAEEPPLAITLKDSPHVLTVGGSKSQDAVVLSPFQLQSAQGFWLKPVGKPEDRRFNIISQQSGQCVDVKDGSREEGAPLVQRECSGASCQVFHVSDRGTDGHREIRNQLSGKCLAAPQGGNSSGAQLVQWKCTGQDNQRFRISPAQTTASTKATPGTVPPSR
ncbi:RICIN domain-containing protein [Archangium lansingense]|uniref:RICIN domain-containing protein n=1 Tax=Archangium lansingense TaxID=2995310 RepID=A0ABT4AFF3_9BACT|nr:RICIN domain-containing protein [Archangium lansinium]MCY1080031.1 RICIN domain-containing protein [Archangium lansinium]